MLPAAWSDLASIALTAVLLYVAIVAGVRIAGKRSTSKMNNFDWIVTVALGSIVGSTILFKDVELADGLAATAALLLLQWSFTKAAYRWPAVRKAIKAPPTLLVYRGDFLPEAMGKQRVSEEEIRAALREQGVRSVADVLSVVLEADGELSVLSGEEGSGATVLADVSGSRL